MREGWRLWFLFVGLCLIGPLLAALYWQQSPTSPVQVTASDGKTGIQAVLDEAAYLLNDFQQRYGHLPCPVAEGSDAQQFNLSEASLAAQRFCEDAGALEHGVAKGRLPWRALGMIKDPGLLYRVPQEAVDVGSCHLAEPAVIASDAQALDAANQNALSAIRWLPGCAGALKRATILPAYWDAASAGWQTPYATDAKLPPAPQGNAAQAMLSPDGQWLLRVDVSADDAGIRWVRWWHASSDARQWIAIGRWHVPEASSVADIRFSGNRIFVAHENAQALRIADIPVWPHGRAVRYESLAAHAWQGMAALPDGRGLLVKQLGIAWQLLPMDAAWSTALQPDYWPAFAETTIGARLAPSGMKALSWDAKGKLELWSRNEGAWHAVPLSLGKPHGQSALPIDVFWQEDAHKLYLRDADHWHGWDTQNVKPIGVIKAR